MFGLTGDFIGQFCQPLRLQYPRLDAIVQCMTLFESHYGSLKSGIGRVAAFGARIAFPPVCVGCRRIVAEPGTLCPQCWLDLRHLERPWCAVFGTPFSHDMGTGFLSAAAIADPPPFDRARAAVAYDGVARRIVQNLKYRDRTDLAPWMAGWMMRAGKSLIADADVIVPVPLHRHRFFSRRFNQSAELARVIARKSGLAFAPEAVVRIRPTRRQVGLAAREREENVRGAFRIPEERDIDLRGRRVLIVDDVYTTGATVSSMTRAVLKHKPAGVDILTFARVIADT